MKLLKVLLFVATLAAGFWAYTAWEAYQSRSVVITLDLGSPCPASEVYFEQIVLYVKHPAETPVEVRPTLKTPARKEWTLDARTFAHTELHVRNRLGILVPWNRELLHTDFDTLIRQRQRRMVNLTVGGNVAQVTFRRSDRPLDAEDYWRHSLGNATAVLRDVDALGDWPPLPQIAGMRNDFTTQFALVTPGDYLIEILNSSGMPALTGTLHVPADSTTIQNLAAEVKLAGALVVPSIPVAAQPGTAANTTRRAK